MNTSLKQFIQKQYNIEQIIDTEEIKMGYLSTNFKVITKNNTYFLKTHNQNSLKEINELIAVQTFFEKEGIKSIPFMLNKEGQEVIQLDNNYYSLFPFINGTLQTRETVNLNQIANLAKMLASMHKVVLDQKPSFNHLSHEIKINLDNTIFNQIKTELKKEIWQKDDLFQTAKNIVHLQEIAKKTIDAEYINNLKLAPSILTHGDFHLKNIFFDQDDILCVFDWEKASYTSRYYELFNALDLICFGTTYTTETWNKAKEFIKYYHATLPIELDYIKDEIRFFFARKVYETWLLNEYFLKKNTRIAPLIPKVSIKLNFYATNQDALYIMIKDIVEQN